MTIDYALRPEMIDIIAVIVVFAAGLLRGLTGFGFALVAAIGLGQIWDPTLVAPLVLICEIALAMLLVGDNVLPYAERHRVLPLVGGGLIGTAVGAWGIATLPADWLTPALDAAVLASAVAALIHVRARWLDHPAVGAVVGFIVGALAAAFAVGGPFAVVWLIAIGAAPAAIRANLVLFFGVIDISAVIMRWASVGFPAEATTRALWLLPIALVGAYLGGRLFTRIDALWWRRIAAWSIALGAALSLARRAFT